MATSLPGDLNARVSQLERVLWRWERVTSVIGIVMGVVSGILAVLIFQSWKGPGLRNGLGEVVARRFIAIDEHGNPLVEIGDLGDGAVAGLLVYPTKATESQLKAAGGTLEKKLKNHVSGMFTREREAYLFLDEGASLDRAGVTLSSTPSGSSVELVDKPSERARVSVIELDANRNDDVLGPDSAQIYALSGDKRSMTLEVSDPRSFAGTGRQLPGEVSVQISDPLGPDQKPFRYPRTAELKLVSDGTSQLQFEGGDFQPEADLSVDSEKSPSLNLYDADGQLRAALGSTDLETIKTGATETTAPSSLTLFDKDGKVMWSRP
jgi:hypothetical protein